jgi:hypothetical protein
LAREANPDGFWEELVDWSGREAVETAGDSTSRVLRAVIDTATTEPELFTDGQIDALRRVAGAHIGVEVSDTPAVASTPDIATIDAPDASGQIE